MNSCFVTHLNFPENENQLEHCAVDKHPVYLHLQRNHQSSPESVLSHWNLGVGPESQTK